MIAPLVSENSLPWEDLLISKKLISPDQLQVAKVESEKTQKSLTHTLTELGFITDQILTDIFKNLSGIERFELIDAVLDKEVVTLLPKEIALRWKVLPLSIDHGILALAMSDPSNIITLDELARYLPPGLEIKPFLSKESSILESIHHYFEHNLSLDKILTEISSTSTKISREGLENPIIRLVNAFILRAVQQHASDIHLEPEASFIRIRYRIDGLLKQEFTFHKDYWSPVCVRLKILSGINIAETRNPQNGRFSLSVGSRKIDFRVSTHPTLHGENLVVRILDKAKALLPLNKIGFQEKIIEQLKKCIRKPEGLIIVTGPTGCGKTTTLYSLLNYVNSLEVNIMTLEQPIEYEIPLIRQTEIHEEKGMSFGEGVRSILRQDPDIILIGEIRDADTAQMALRAAMTGHQVYTTLHTNSALSALQRLYDLGILPSLLGGNLLCILAQRLMRKLCPHCKRPRKPTSQEKNILGLKSSSIILFEAEGCKKCEGSGYKGRIPIAELIECSETFNQLISQGASLKELEQEINTTFFSSLKKSAFHQLLEGTTTLKEALKTLELE